jgi:hypothetical protein
MYSRKAWGGEIDPFILTKFVKVEDDTSSQDNLVSLVIFEWADESLIGRPVPGTDDVCSINCTRRRDGLTKRTGVSYNL